MIFTKAVKVGQLGSPRLAHHESQARTSKMGWLTFLMSHKNTNPAQPTRAGGLNGLAHQNIIKNLTNQKKP